MSCSNPTHVGALDMLESAMHSSHLHEYCGFSARTMYLGFLVLLSYSDNNANVLKSLWYNKHCVQHTNLPTLPYQYLRLKTHIVLYIWFWHAVYQYNSMAELCISRYVVLALTQLYQPQNFLLTMLFIL